MFAVVVTFEIKSGMIDDFMPLMINNAQQSLKDEPGCKQFDVCTDPKLPDEVFLYELYADAAAFQNHLKANHFLDFDKAVANMIADKTVRTYSVVAS
ncbi:MAG: putative quinol monooxygenase [Roseibium sp.]